MTDDKTDVSLKRVSFRTGMRIPAEAIEKRYHHQSGQEILLRLRDDPDYLYLVDENDVLTYRVLNNPQRVSPLPYPPEELIEVGVAPPEPFRSGSGDTAITVATEIARVRGPQIELPPLLRGSPPGTRLSPEALSSLLPHGTRGRLFRVTDRWVGVDDNGIVVFNEFAEPTTPPAPAAEPPSPPAGAADEFDEGDALPYLDDRWQPDGPRFRARIGRFLYYCQSRPDQGYLVTDKLLLPATDAGGAEVSSPVAEPAAVSFRLVVPPEVRPPPAPPPVETPPPAPTPPAVVAPGQTVCTALESMRRILVGNQVQAVFYLDKVVAPDTAPIWLSVLRGDLAQLNEDTQKAFHRGISTKSPAGFSLLKGALIHLLYVNSIRAQRGDDQPAEKGKRMKGVLYQVILLREDGTSAADTPVISQGVKERILGAFSTLAGVEGIDSRREVVERVHRQILLDPETQIALNHPQTLAQFKALMLFKLYQYTQMVDRGDGLAIIRLVRAIIDFPTLSSPA